MSKQSLIITSIADQSNKVLKYFAKYSKKNGTEFILVGDKKSPVDFNLPGCDFYSINRQKETGFKLTEKLPYSHYSRKNIGYLIAFEKQAEIIIETDDDNFPLKNFWNKRKIEQESFIINDKGWVNIYKFFTDKNIWPRGFALEKLKDIPSMPKVKMKLKCPIQQGLADKNPDVDAIYRLTLPLPLDFIKTRNIALGNGSICPFNSQNTTWFKEAFGLMYLPSYCSFRMTDIWRSFVAQRIAWTCNWPIMFHNATVYQERNDHNLLKDFKDEIVGYINNYILVEELKKLDLKMGEENIFSNLILCYKKMIDLKLIDEKELFLIDAWIEDILSID